MFKTLLFQFQNAIHFIQTVNKFEVENISKLIFFPLIKFLLLFQ